MSNIILTPSRSLVSESCSYCKQPVFADEGYNSVTGNHGKCQHDAATDVKHTFTQMDEVLSSFGMKPRCRVGDGQTAQRLKKRVIALVEAHYGIKVSSVVIWGQQGAYRGSKWDLASWGMDMVLEGNKFNVAVCSWGTMTACLKDKDLRLMPDGLHSFEV